MTLDGIEYEKDYLSFCPYLIKSKLRKNTTIFFYFKQLAVTCLDDLS